MNLMEMYLINDFANNYRIDCNEERVDDSVKELKIPNTNYILWFNLVVNNVPFVDGTEISSVEIFDLAILDEDFQDIEVEQHILDQIETSLTKSIYKSY